MSTVKVLYAVALALEPVAPTADRVEAIAQAVSGAIALEADEMYPRALCALVHEALTYLAAGDDDVADAAAAALIQSSSPSY